MQPFDFWDAVHLCNCEEWVEKSGYYLNENFIEDVEECLGQLNGACNNL